MSISQAATTLCPYCGRALHWMPTRWLGRGVFQCEQCGDFPDFRTNAARQFPFYVKDEGYAQWYWDTSENHGGGGNLLFVDGHARWKQQQALRCRDFGLLPPDDAPTFLLGEYQKTWSAAF